MRYKGSFTVEAALIMPVILGVIVLFIYLGMFAHDRCTIRYVCQMAAVDAVYEKGDQEAFVKDTVRYELENRLILDWDVKTQVISDESDIYVSVRAEVAKTVFAKLLTEPAQFDIICLWSKGYRACLKNRDI